MTIKGLADKLRKFNVEACDISWLLDQPTVETAIMTACEDRLEVVMKLVSPAAWADYLRTEGGAWADYESIKDSDFTDSDFTDYVGIRNTTKMELLEALEKA